MSRLGSLGSQGSTDPEEQRRSITTGTYLAIGVVVVVVACALVAVGVRLFGGDDAAESRGPVEIVPSHPSAAPAAPDSTDDATQGLGAPTVDRLGRRVDLPKWAGGWALPQNQIEHGPYSPAAPVTAPAGVSWQKVNDGAIVPFSTSDGPIAVDGLTAVGFAHSPQGAALAAWQIAMRLGASNNEVARKIYDRQVVMSDSQRRELYSQLDSEGPYHRGASDAVLSHQSKADAFRVREYADDLAVIEYASVAQKADDGTDQWLTSRLIASWVDGDWKLTFPEQLGDPTGTSTSLSGWTTW
jgi:hypothetical protein